MSNVNYEEILKKMSLEEKIAFCSGADFWTTKKLEACGVPALVVSDGPNGLRKQDQSGDMFGVNQSREATCFPPAVTTANSWDTALLKRVGAAIGEEAKQQKVGVVLGPGANLKRNPLCGRNFEYFSEDPYLTGKLAAAFVRGAEETGAGTSLKHFACNSQERDRLVSDGVMDERTLRELYLPGFEAAVKEGRPATVMCSYPKLNGVHLSDNRKLLTEILRDEWGYEGVVVTDWGAMNDRIAGFRAGCDLVMPGGSAYMEKECLQAVKSGELSEADVDRCVERILKLVFEKSRAMTGEPCDYAAHHALAEEAAVSGAVLLKNEDGLLPLRRDSRLAVVGAMAKSMRYQGAGSSHINPVDLTQPLDVFPACSYAVGCDEQGNTSDALLAEAAQAAENAEAVIVFAGLPDSSESEGSDRKSMKMPEGHIRMIEAVAAANPNTVVLLMCGSAVECPWADRVKSILYLGLPGQAGGSAMAKLVFGEASPSGKLAESWPYVYEDVPSAETYGKQKDALYEEGIYVGYRYYDKAGTAVRWPFGHGLSYTEFAYSDLKIEGRTVTVTVKNIGGTDGGEVVQLYVKAPQDGLHRPLRELKGFDKVFLRAGEEAKLRFTLDDRSFAVYDGGWKVPKGRYEICVGPLSVPLELEGESVPAPAWQKGSFYESCSGKPTRTEWEKLLGHAYVPAAPQKKGEYTMESTPEDMAKHSLVMKLLCRVTERSLKKAIGITDPEDPRLALLLKATVGGPLRSMCISGGKLGRAFPGMLEMANGHPVRGIVRMIRR